MSQKNVALLQIVGLILAAALMAGALSACMNYREPEAPVKTEAAADIQNSND